MNITEKEFQEAMGVLSMTDILDGVEAKEIVPPADKGEHVAHGCRLDDKRTFGASIRVRTSR